MEHSKLKATNQNLIVKRIETLIPPFPDEFQMVAAIGEVLDSKFNEVKSGQQILYDSLAAYFIDDDLVVIHSNNVLAIVE